MIDWSDPMPGTNMVFGMRRNWIQPGQAIRSERYFMQCSELASSPGSARLEITMIIFDDGTGEGNTNQINFFLRGRRQRRDEMLKWTPRFTALRSAGNLHSAAKQLYRDLTTAKHESEADPGLARANGLARVTLERLQNLALEVTEHAQSSPVLDQREAWQITDLEQRTERIVRGAGPSDTSAAQ